LFKSKFVSKDSAEIDNGIETFSLPIGMKEDTCILHHAYRSPQGIEDLEVIYINDSILVINDAGYTKKTMGSRFKKSTASFQSLVNEATISATYQIITPKSKTQLVEFTPGGDIIGLSPYTNYEICYAGDCLEEPLIPALVISLKSPDQSKDFTWQYDKQTQILTLFNLEKPKKDIKGERRFKEYLCDLKKYKLKNYKASRMNSNLIRVVIHSQNMYLYVLVTSACILFYHCKSADDVHSASIMSTQDLTAVQDMKVEHFDLRLLDLIDQGQLHRSTLINNHDAFDLMHIDEGYDSTFSTEC
jgi:hypothetical protein